MSDDVLGPIDFVLIEFADGQYTGEAAGALLDLVERGIVRIFDLVAIRKEADGSFSGLEVTDLTADHLGGFAAFAGARSGLVGDEDLAEAAAAMDPDTTAVLIVYENTWAGPFVAAAHRAGGQLVASARIRAQDLLDVLDELDATDPA